MSISKPRVALICHENDVIDAEGLRAWLACSFELAGVVLLRDPPGSLLPKLRRECRRVGFWRLLDVLLFRLFYQLRFARADAAWMEAERLRLQERYRCAAPPPAKLVSYGPNTPEVRDFLRKVAPDLTIARCKYILKPEIFSVARHGTYVLHPGICPEYRNAHGCFWALANGDLGRVGMTLLRVDPGIDTGPIFLQRSYSYDERHESHIVIQYRVVLENLDAITETLHAVCRGSARTLETAHRPSMNWGQPWLSAYLQWKKRVAREAMA